MGVQSKNTRRPNRIRINSGNRNTKIRFGAAMSPRPSVFAPLLYAGYLELGIERLANAGFDAIEISLRRVDEVDIDWLEKTLAKNKISVSAIATGRICLEDCLCLSNTNPDVGNRVYERLVELIRLAARLKASLIIGGVRGKLAVISDEQTRQRAVVIDTIRRCARVAEDFQVTLLLEPINHNETNFINTSQEGLAFLKDIGNPSMRLLLDTFHMDVEGENLRAAIHNAESQLGYIHFADTSRLPPGKGHIDFSAVIQTLVDIGYSGFITVEILPKPDDDTALYETAKYLRSITSNQQFCHTVL